MTRCELVVPLGIEGALDRTLGTHEFVALPREGERVTIRYRGQPLHLEVTRVTHYPFGEGAAWDTAHVIVFAKDTGL